MLKNRAVSMLGICLLLLLSTPIASAEIKVTNGDCPVYTSSHIMGSQVISYPNGLYSMMGIFNGFTADKFPVQVTFHTLTNFISVGRYQPVSSAVVLTDSTGKNNLARYEFQMKFERPGTMFTQVIAWKVILPSEGFYAFNIFVDGTLVGYYPFYVWSR